MILKTNVPPGQRRLHPELPVTIPARALPSFRAEIAKQDGVHRNILMDCLGGLGDEICAEPTLRYAQKYFNNCDVSLYTDHPELFRHIPFKRVFNSKDRDSVPNGPRFFVLTTLVNQVDEEISFHFFAHLTTHCVDFCSIHALRMQLPIADREVMLVPQPPAEESEAWRALGQGARPQVIVHAGKHWESKTFPKDWWDAVLLEIRKLGATPVLIGADLSLCDDPKDNRTTVDVDPSGCIDLRNKLSVMDSVWLLQNSRVLLTNDSAPLHMAVTGNAWVGFIATSKHPDYITHWRKGQWGWRMKNFGLGGVWDVYRYNPNGEVGIDVDKVEESLLRSWLPPPNDYAAWAVQKASE